MVSFAELKTAFRAWRQDQASTLAAALSYHAVFSLAPLLVVILAVVGLLYKEATTSIFLTNEISQFFGIEIATLLNALVQDHLTLHSGWAISLGSILTLVAAANGVNQLRLAVNQLWNHPPSVRSWKQTVLRYATLFVFLGVTGLALLMFLLMSALITDGNVFLTQFLNIDILWLLPVSNALLSLVGVTLLFAGIFKYLPESLVPWPAVWPAALVTAVFFNIGKFGIGLYITHSSVRSVYGAAGSLAIFLLWMFYEAQILLYGVELTKVQAETLKNKK